MFPQATLLIQKAELDFAFAPGKPAPFQRERPTRALEATSTCSATAASPSCRRPGTRPGTSRCCCSLPQTGWVVLSGDLTHFRDNWENRRVASMNTSPEQTQASLQRVAQILADKAAQLWINHDKPQSNGQRHSPAYYD
jgi:hypothetical protein